MNLAHYKLGKFTKLLKRQTLHPEKHDLFD